MKAWKLPLCAAIAAVSSSAYAVEPNGISLGSGVTFLPAVELTVSDDSNIYKLPDETKVDSTVTRLKPSFGIQADLGTTQLSAGYVAEKGMYTNDSDDNYIETRLSASSKTEVSSRDEVDFNLNYNIVHDDRGSGTVEGNAAIATEPDTYDETVVGAAYIYGSDSAMLNLKPYAEYYNKHYTNNKNLGTADRNYSQVKLGALLSVKVSSATKALLEVRSADISYEEDSAKAKGREGNLMNLLAGASWDITGKTTGEVKLGALKRSFDESGIDDSTRFAWEAQLIWNPRSYSTVTFLSQQTANETNDPGTYIASQYSLVSWDHEFSPFVSVVLDASLSNDEYIDDAAGREDEVVSYGVTGVFSPSKILDIKASLKDESRDSSIAALDYDRQIIMLGFAVAI
ncbi:outer membrane beta-barrel protein [Thalassolituus oleivorans]|uniref:outer membrane beta-barrel protein n=1 Tax=Thalassolituus oleivorans TaxID=187493 RepID=UPI0023F18516|nr:outer membrane beta-barrel protein [Thalassolituus oleivorans]